MVSPSVGSEGAPSRSPTLGWNLSFIDHAALLNRSRSFRSGAHRCPTATLSSWPRYDISGLVLRVLVEQVRFLGSHGVSPRTGHPAASHTGSGPTATKRRLPRQQALPRLQLLGLLFKLVFYFEIIPNSPEYCKNSSRYCFPLNRLRVASSKPHHHH